MEAGSVSLGSRPLDPTAEKSELPIASFIHKTQALICGAASASCASHNLRTNAKHKKFTIWQPPRTGHSVP